MQENKSLIQLLCSYYYFGSAVIQVNALHSAATTARGGRHTAEFSMTKPNAIHEVPNTLH